ncbi:AAA family ATPase [Romboutsia sp.]|uniref:AAA family ATPase n=1 Tax=Romboutsia sp. TaxID=1965302 RepID=UPI003F36F8C0
MNQNIKSIFSKIEENLNKELIGQDKYLNKLCNYFENKISKEEKGIIFLIGEKETSKKTSIKLMFENIKEYNLLKTREVEQIDLASYNFNLGYNAFLTDLYEKLNNSSECIIFKNIEDASEEIISTIKEIAPNSCIALKNDYIIKNRFLVEYDGNEEKTINEIVCHNKFLVFTSYNDSFNIEKVFSKEFEDKVDIVLHTKKLNKHERNLILKKEVLETVKRVESNLKIKIILDTKEDQETGEHTGIYKFLQESYKKDSNFGIYEYVSYKFCKPLTNLIREEEVNPQSTIMIYAEHDDLYCKCEKGSYNLGEYSIPTLQEAKYKLNSIIGINELKEFIENVKNNYRVQQIRERLGLKTSKISMNMIFVGNAGTGKTNAARVTYEYLNALGVLSNGVYKEVSKADFVTENTNDVAKRTIDIINSAKGGVLFVDEAYSLCESDEDKVGKEIVDALLKGIEDNRDDVVVILAGYEKDMEEFLSFNQGLKSRFPNIIHFNDYTPVEMYEIAVNIAKAKGYRIAKNVENDLIDLFTKNQISGKNDLGNARFVRNIIENAILDASKKYLTDKNKQIDLLEKDNFNFKVKAKFDLEEKLSEIVGLLEVKKLLRSQYKLIVAQEKRKSVGVNTKIDQNLNMVFTGNPGTGKTSIARLVAEMLNSMGLLKTGQLIETDRSSFISEIPGETSKKTETKFKEALGGVLFIDEAYTLANDSLGREAVETLLKLIEDYSKEVIVILAGYTEEMEEFFDVNIGLKSRFPLWTNFADYNPNELLEMSIKLIESKGFKLSKNANVALKKRFVDIYEESDSQSGNGRMVRNYVENLIRNQSIRISEEDISVYEMNLITVKDIEKVDVSEYENEFNLEEKLEKLIYNEKAKNFLNNQYKFIKIEERRAKAGIKNEINKYNNIIFTGNAGSGKKNILSLLSEMYYSRGLIKAKSIVEFDINEISSMINKGEKIEDVLNKSLEKVILIDKAHLLIEKENYEEIVSSLIKFIDKNKNRLYLALVGQQEGIRKLLSLNPPLNYRFPIYFNFEDYTSEELYNICVNILIDKGFEIDNCNKKVLSETITEIYKKNPTLKNGLLIKNFLDQLIRAQSIRIYDENIESKNINVISKEDIIESKEELLLRI